MGTLAQLLDRIDQVCPLPATAQKVVQLASDPNAALPAIAQVIATDPALSAEVMKLANSAAFGRSRTVSELEHAVALIGLREIHSMASAMAMLAAFAPKAELGLRLHDYSVLAGSIARTLSQSMDGLERSEAFLCGLLSEIGAMACAAVDPRAYDALWQRAAEDADLRDSLEVETYGATTRTIAGALLRRHRLPERVAAAVEGDPTAGSLGRLTQFARAAAPLIVTSAHQPDGLGSSLSALAEENRIALSPDDLLAGCLKAAEQTLNAIRRAR
jgi:HD-like signal output (HDOD) protein